ncbi:MAG: ribosomal L7Ae/L30e/S12e/Gadd45 family protein [Caldicoprobacter oshimai]|uniref:LSU ribosomal protein L7AE n=1 Tax=Caldicoprobacter faecalis TaxID=937334 RepID=A0A1I5YW23_9FIRM|nr:ribosomal L7Ae/L30e/S12e/Gadd45 family protein [Caldicoprobacter faecalis]PZN10793.1 MAG: 50S ribosomal protein L7ae-like protein [Caldicoprobacter oshimai]SFQ48205.1 LSU ribosomal protein L7AE [Caldicoprobacter faecalis]
MLEELKNASAKTVGTKQTLKAINAGKAVRVYLAKDVDEYISERIKKECEKNNVPIFYVNSMKELGRICGIDVGAATAAILRDADRKEV